MIIHKKKRYQKFYSHDKGRAFIIGKTKKEKIWFRERHKIKTSSF